MAGVPSISDITHDAVAASFVSFGVTVDGGGFVIVNGRPIHVDPWGPLFNVAASLAAIHNASLISDRTVRAKIQKAAFEAATEEMNKLGQQISGRG